MFQISGILTTLSPLNIADPSQGRVDLDGRFVPGDKGFPCVRTRHAPFPAVFAPAPIDQGDDDGFDDLDANDDAKKPEAMKSADDRRKAPLVNVPVVPANSLRGRLRRYAAREYYNVLIERGQRLSLDAFAVMQCGAAAGAPDGVPPNFEEVRAAEADPYFGLFGGGPRMFRSNLRCDDAIAVCEASASFVPESAGAFMNQGRLTEVRFKRRNDDVAAFNDVETQQAIIEDYEAAVGRHQDASAKTRAARGKKDEDDEAVRGVQSFHAVEAVRRGVNFALRFDIDGSHAHLGLFLRALARLLDAQRLGGMGQLGFGRFAVPTLTMFDDHGEGGEIFAPLSTAQGRVVHAFNAGNLLVQRAMDAWAAEIDLIDPARIERFAASNKPVQSADGAGEAGGKRGKKG